MFPERLRYARKLRGYSQEELAKKINSTKSTISNYENEYSSPSNEILKNLADILHTSTDFLLGRSDNINESEENSLVSMEQINQFLKKYKIDQSGFFDIEKWKAMGPEEFQQLESYFQFIVSEAEEKNKQHD
ncbi:helix-turn-helix domain-containing protein [Oceanobacillus sp. FSL H7-0719]|uniref:helix-turn-helix domain-containing protein n=1 Tax=Oceanobacillus sp. FSL H7-0719 TaxID=2954507 RepID=UPI0032561D5D